MSSESLLERARAGWPRGFPVVQFPNPPLLLAVAALVLAALTTGTVRDAARATAHAALAAWAWLEVVDGANAFRRILGGAVLVLVIVRIADALGD